MKTSRRQFGKWMMRGGLLVPFVAPRVVKAAAVVINPYRYASAPVTYDFRETFEGTGYSETGWTEDISTTGIVDEDYVTNILKGSQSCRVQHPTGASFLYRTQTGTPISFSWMWKPLGTAPTFTSFVSCSSTGNYYDDALVRVRIQNTDQIQFQLNGAAVGSDVNITANGVYRFWLDWVQNGTTTLAMSGNGDETKPSPQWSGTAPNTAMTYIALLSGTAGDMVFDDFIRHSTTIGSNP